MDPVYDLKMLKEGHPGRLKGTYEWILSRMDSAQRAAWDRFYDPIIEDFYTRNPQGRERAEWKFNRYMRDYLKTLKSLDDNVGRLLRYLDESGLAENTLVVYTSDQGFYMGEHGWFDKRFMYEESMRTPLVMRMPGGARGDIGELVQNIDYAPTFLELAGVEVPADIQGRSLLPLLRGQHPSDWRPALYYHFYEYPAEHMVKRHYGVRNDRWKLIHFYNDIDCWELYDLENDPHELHNLFGDPAYAGEQHALSRSSNGCSASTATRWPCGTTRRSGGSDPAVRCNGKAGSTSWGGASRFRLPGGGVVPADSPAASVPASADLGQAVVAGLFRDRALELFGRQGAAREGNDRLRRVSVTVAETPPIEFSAFSTCARQWPHIMPSTLNLRSIVSCFLVVCIGSIRRRFSRRLFVTTLTLLIAIAAPAIIGSSRKPHSG